MKKFYLLILGIMFLVAACSGTSQQNDSVEATKVDTVDTVETQAAEETEEVETVTVVSKDEEEEAGGCIEGEARYEPGINVTTILSSSADAKGCFRVWPYTTTYAGNKWILASEPNVDVEFHELGDIPGTVDGPQFPIAICIDSPRDYLEGGIKLRDLVGNQEWPWSSHYLEHSCYTIDNLEPDGSVSVYFK